MRRSLVILAAFVLNGAGAGAEPGQVPSAFENSLGMRFVPVPGTQVLFSIWDTRVQDFEAFVAATGYDATVRMNSLRNGRFGPYGGSWASPGFAQGKTHPVCGVSWADAHSFCTWLTRKERTEHRLGADQACRLPTDAEWSAAAGLPRESGDTPEEKSKKIRGIYPWGTQWPPPRGSGNYGPRR
jgi:formylglycine-generating enzyme required for sulfatase activity